MTEQAATGYDRRRWHGLDARVSCYLCDAAEETCDHLLFECSFSRQVWDAVLAPLGLTRPIWRRVRGLWPASVRRGGDSLIVLVTWLVWKERNARCFRGEVSSVDSVVCSVVSVASEWVRAGASALGALGCTIRE
ncbi:hypothetical protein BS78_05G232500 [Paspalum vaginatum]|nr:hypothetical protein BS78_05G232500 [Paspalum vaginatum]